MAKTVSLNEFTYSLLASLSGELTATAKKPISLGMTVHIALITFQIELHDPQIKKQIQYALPKATSPQEFDEQWEEAYRVITKSNTSEQVEG